MSELLEVKHLTKRFVTRKSLFQPKKELLAVDDVSFSLEAGKTLGIVGESGSGKSTLARCVMRLYDDVEGTILLQGEDITRLSQRQLRPYRKKMQMVFQDPFSSLNPRMSAQEIVEETLYNQGVGDGKERRERALETMELCGLSRYHATRFPHEFSGGQRQRLAIARAFVSRPDLVICDEPTSALDVSIQAQIINLLMDLQEEMGLSYLFISHDLAVVEHIAQEVAVMYRGRVVEQGPREVIFQDPRHAYTKRLLAAIPPNHPREARHLLPDMDPVSTEGELVEVAPGHLLRVLP